MAGFHKIPAMRDFQTPTRSAVYAPTAMAATSHPRATLAAIETMKAGGNAMDAAICAAAALAVVAPQMTGIGGDCFVLYAPAGKDVIAYNGSGAAVAAAETSWYLDQGMDEIPVMSPHAVTIPGAVEAWHRLNAGHGRKEFAELLRPAIALAEDGFPVPPRVAYDWDRFDEKINRTEAGQRVFLRNGKPAKEGDVIRQPELAATLRIIAEQGPKGFYEGPVAEDMVATLQRLGGLHVMEDFAGHAGIFVEPISTNYRGYDIHECPPNGQGFVALIMLNICEGFDVSEMSPLDATRLHLQAEAGRLAYRDRDAFLGDSEPKTMSLETLLSKEYAAGQRALISPDRAIATLPDPALRASSDTVYLSVVDCDGNAVSFINSLFNGFGTGIMSDATGVMLHNRGALFKIDENHPARIEPGRRPPHTIMPGIATKDGRTVMSFGVMGGHYQPFGHTHLLGNVIDFGLDVQQALELPRVFHYDDVLSVEIGIPDETADQLRAMGHDVETAPVAFGGGQAIWIDHERGILIGGSDPRKDGSALGY